jgi:superfamily I DNA and/or RNA helicase
MPLPEHFSRLIDCLSLEADAELVQFQQRTRRQSGAEAERSGNRLIRLAIRDERPALGGRMILTLGKRDQTQSLPWNRFHVGTPVMLTEEQLDGKANKPSSSWRGVVCQRDAETLDVACAELPETEADRPTFRLDFATDEIARQRQQGALNQAGSTQRGRLAQLREVLLGERAPKTVATKPLEVFNEHLDASQHAAVQFALAAEDVAIVHGPPGTGKTTTVIELIRQAIARGEKVLACAPSNLAVDNLLERLVRAGEAVVRLGHPARVLPELQEHTLDLLVDAHPDVAIARKLLREAQGLRDKAARFTRAKPLPGARQEMRQEARELVADAKRIEEQVVQHILDSAGVLCATLTGLDGSLLGDREFDLLVIDEAAQAIEPACWIPLLRAKRVVLAGDHFQLPPTILSNEAARAGLSVSLLERLMVLYGSSISRQLTVQYRMHEQIMAFSSATFYENSLVAHESVQAHVLQDLPKVLPQQLTASAIEFIDTAGASYDEEPEPDGASLLNPAEAELVGRKVQALLEANVAPSEIAVIVPYSAQARLLRQQLAIPGLEVDTVDGFQGREKEAVIISLVRSNTRGEIGFLSDTRRMNVALTRARRKLIVIGDSATLGHHAFYQQLLRYFEEQLAYRTVWEEM